MGDSTGGGWAGLVDEPAVAAEWAEAAAPVDEPAVAAEWAEAAAPVEEPAVAADLSAKSPGTVLGGFATASAACLARSAKSESVEDESLESESWLESAEVYCRSPW